MTGAIDPGTLDLAARRDSARVDSGAQGVQRGGR
jgi:hypothetical protein